MPTRHLLSIVLATSLFALSFTLGCRQPPSPTSHSSGAVSNVADSRPETRADSRPPASAAPSRLDWWRDTRLGMFIHWGLYAIPAGQWSPAHPNTHGEWIRSEAKVPRAEYTAAMLHRFNPTRFDADAIVRAAKDAGMGYLVITTKHHDGFCLFNSAHTDFDVMSTPFNRDIMREIADACRRHGLRIGWYYSIMDWHHPDYLPRRDWETDATHPTTGADFDRYIAYMKAQLTELLTNYGDIGVLWFDGQWEGQWNDVRGRDLEAHVRALQPNIIINSRVGRGGGAYGLDGARLGDYSTPEQFIPETNPGIDWETCMTMNRHWGYNAADKDFKSAATLIAQTADIASKGGNFLLNIGPTAEGDIPPESVDRLAAMATYMAAHAPSIKGTLASPFPAALPWGACTMRPTGPQTRLYLHVKQAPADGRLVLPGLLNTPVAARIMGESQAVSRAPLAVTREGENVVVSLAGNPLRTPGVIELDLEGTPDVATPPAITASASIFVGTTSVTASSTQKNVTLRYRTDGNPPTTNDPTFPPAGVTLHDSATVSVRAFRDGRAVSPVSTRAFERVTPAPPVAANPARLPGLRVQTLLLPGDIKALDEIAPKWADAATPSKYVLDFSLTARPRERHFALRFTGFIDVPIAGVYRFFTASDDGSRIRIGSTLVVNNDLPHSLKEESGDIALAAGLHPIEVEFFENWGGCELTVSWQPPAQPKALIPAHRLRREP